MRQVHKSALVRYSARKMFDLVDAVEKYPEFLPWCSASCILKREGNIVEAELEISRRAFRQTFATRNLVIPGQEIRMTLLRGPFSYLEGFWRFQPLREDASKISLDLSFEMNSRLGSLAFGAVFNQICDTMVSAFTQRARDLYG